MLGRVVALESLLLLLEGSCRWSRSHGALLAPKLGSFTELGPDIWQVVNLGYQDFLLRVVND